MFIYLCFSLLAGGQKLHAETHCSGIDNSSSFNFSNKQEIKLLNSSQAVVIEIADIDIDEEFHGSNSLTDLSAYKKLVGKESFLNNWYLTFSRQSFLKVYFKHFKNLVNFYANSNPIFLRIGVLRI